MADKASDELVQRRQRSMLAARIDGNRRKSLPLYNAITVRAFGIVVGLLAVSLSLWFVSAASVRIYQVPPDAFFYFHQLPLSYWIGLVATLALFGARGLVSNRARMLLELSTLFLLSLYLFAIPSVSYQDPRILDSYQHEGNALALIGARGWFNGPIWYVFQFPGAYTFFAQLTAIPGIDSFQVMKLYPAGLAIILSLLLYALAKNFSPNYAAVTTAFIMSGLWFQLHLSPQSLELIMYVGVIFLLWKIIDDEPRRDLWEMIALVTIPILVLSHPETPLVMLLGIAGFFVVKPLFTAPRKSSIKSTLSLVGPFFLMLAIVTLAWWSGIASQALAEVQSIINGALTAGIPGLSHGAPNIPPTPAPDYHVTTLLQEGISASVWLLGLAVLLFVRRFNLWEFLLSGLFLAAISTIPIALFANADVLQRSYLFALFPAGLLFASLFERKKVLRIQRLDLVRPLSLIMLVMIILFASLMPMTRFAGDSFDSLPQSSLYTSNLTASLSNHSILFPHPGWYGWRYYSPSYGYDGGLRLEQNDISAGSGGFVKVNTYAEFNLTFTGADGTANYLLMSDYFNNLYTLRFGPNATYYINSHATFETQASMRFNLVYSTGTDRLYENSQWLG